MILLIRWNRTIAKQLAKLETSCRPLIQLNISIWCLCCQNTWVVLPRLVTKIPPLPILYHHLQQVYVFLLPHIFATSSLRTWTVDSGATRHICYNANAFISSKIIHNSIVHLPNNTHILVYMCGDVNKLNLLYTSSSQKDTAATYVNKVSVSTWHNRLGHLSSRILDLLKHQLNYDFSICNKGPCYICPMAKQKRFPFISSNTYHLLHLISFIMTLGVPFLYLHIQGIDSFLQLWMIVQDLPGFFCLNISLRQLLLSSFSLPWLQLVCDFLQVHRLFK